jgi:hypothetical protein
MGISLLVFPPWPHRLDNSTRVNCTLLWASFYQVTSKVHSLCSLAPQTFPQYCGLSGQSLPGGSPHYTGHPLVFLLTHLYQGDLYITLAFLPSLLGLYIDNWLTSSWAVCSSTTCVLVWVMMQVLGPTMIALSIPISAVILTGTFLAGRLNGLFRILMANLYTTSPIARSAEIFAGTFVELLAEVSVSPWLLFVCFL